MPALVVDMETYRTERRPIASQSHSETADEYAKRRVRDMLKERANAGRLTWVVVTNAAAEAARQVRQGTSVRLAIANSLDWALRQERAPPPNEPRPAA